MFDGKCFLDQIIFFRIVSTDWNRKYCILITFLSVMAWRVMFGKVICLICGTFFPFNLKLLLCLAVTKAIILHVPALGSVFSHGRMNKTCGSWVVCDNFCSSLWMSHASQGITNSDCYKTVVELPPHSASATNDTIFFSGKCPVQLMLQYVKLLFERNWCVIKILPRLFIERQLILYSD